MSHSSPKRHLSGRSAVAGTVAVAVGIGAATLFGDAGVAIAATTPHAQAVGRFLDGAAGGQPLENIVDLKDARATSPGTASAQNPLDVTVGKAQTIPLSGALQLPQIAGIRLGAVNQVAVAHADGYSYGAAGAVSNSGGVSIGGSSSSFPASATIDLTPTGVAKSSPIPIPGGTSAAALGGVTAKVGAVSALASTPSGKHRTASTQYGIGSATLTVASPALGSLLKTLTKALDPSALTTVLNQLPVSSLPGNVIPGACNVEKIALPSSLSLDHGAVVISASDGSLTIDLVKLLDELGLDINRLPANTDLTDYLTKYLTSVDGLSKGLEDLVGDLAGPLQKQFTACAKALPGLSTVIAATMKGQDQLTAALNGLLGQLGSATGSGDPLAPLGSGLKQLIDIGVNVQPHGRSGSFHSALKATPDQATGVVAGQTVVRAIELDLVPAAGAQAPTLALANAAAGPSAPAVATVTPTTSAPATPHGAPDTRLPTGVPAGQGVTGGTPDLPLALLALGVLMAGAGALTWRVRGARQR